MQMDDSALNLNFRIDGFQLFKIHTFYRVRKSFKDFYSVRVFSYEKLKAAWNNTFAGKNHEPKKLTNPSL